MLKPGAVSVSFRELSADELQKYIEEAKILGTDVLRLRREKRIVRI